MDLKSFVRRSRELSKGSWQDRGSGVFWIDHRILSIGDAESLAKARHLILWNVRLPPAFLAGLPRLEILDIRGGSGTTLDHIGDAEGLRALVVNQIRGLDISVVTRLERLEFLSLYRLRRVDRLPPLDRLMRLKRVEVGQMRNLTDISALQDAKALEELLFVRRLGVQVENVKFLEQHPSLRAFDWFWEDVPASQALPVLEALHLPKVRPLGAEEWLRDRHTQTK